MSFCAACGNNMAPGERFCRVCGRDSGAVAGAPPAAATPSRPMLPPKTSGKAIASLVCGLLFFVPFLFIVAIVYGHLGLSEIRKSAGRLTGEGIAIAGLVLGYMGIVSIPMVLIIAAIAIPNLSRARMAANESSAVAYIRVINAAEISYNAQHQDTGYTCSLSELSSLGDSNLAGDRRNGYEFQLTGCSATAEGGANVKYQVVAVPVTQNLTGIRAFCSDESAMIKVSANGVGQDCLDNGVSLTQ